MSDRSALRLLLPGAGILLAAVRVRPGAGLLEPVLLRAPLGPALR